MPDSLFAGRYRFGEPLGRGGMSEVWSATDTELGRRVALKLLAPHADTARFDREARAIASLGHPNVAQLYDYGSAGGRPFMVLEYLPGGTLEERLRDGKRLPDEDAARIAAEVAAGLAHAHARGVVHRDLKPANVLFDAEGRAKLADFGIARLAAGEGTLTEAGTLLGTAAYISPEQAAGEPATAASDVYSFGVILFRMLTGRLPFESGDPMALVALHRDAEPPPLSRFRKDAPARLAATAAAALAKDPSGRPRDGRALVAALGAAAPADPTAVTAVLARPEDATRVLQRPPAPVPSPAGPPTRRPAGGPPSRSRLPLIAAGLLALAFAGVALAYGLTRPSHQRAPTTTAPPTTQPPTHSTPQPTTTAPPPSTAPTTTPTQQTTTQPTTTPPTTTAPPPPTTTAPPPTTTTTPITIPSVSVSLPTAP